MAGGSASHSHMAGESAFPLPHGWWVSCPTPTWLVSQLPHSHMASQSGSPLPYCANYSQLSKHLCFPLSEADYFHANFHQFFNIFYASPSLYLLSINFHFDLRPFYIFIMAISLSLWGQILISH